MIGASEVVFARVENNRPPDNAARAEQCDDVVGVGGRHDAFVVGDDIAQVTDVTNGILTSSMLQFVGVVMAAGAPVASIKVYSDEIATCGGGRNTYKHPPDKSPLQADKKLKSN